MLAVACIGCPAAGVNYCFMRNFKGFPVTKRESYFIPISLLVLPTLKSSSQSEVYLNSSYSFTCAVEGIDLPQVGWKISGNYMSSGAKNISENNGYPIKIVSESRDNHVTSTLSIHTIGFCFGGNQLSCWARNNVQEEKEMQTFTIKPSNRFFNFLAIFKFSFDSHR